MRTVHVDISILLRVRFTTGVQRVVRELVNRLHDAEGIDLRLLRYDAQQHDYLELPREVLDVDYEERLQVAGLRRVPLDGFAADSVFLDLDAGWAAQLKRPVLYPVLARCGVQIITYVYDLVPLEVPRTVAPRTFAFWVPWLASVMAYSNLVLSDSRSAERGFLSWCDRVGAARRPATLVTRLGCDVESSGELDAQDVERLERLEGRRFLLVVGTIEPRKRVTLALDVFDLLQDKHPDLDIVFVGRYGWRAREIVDTLLEHPAWDTRVHWWRGVSDVCLDQLYDRATACLYLSRHEGFGLPIAEALAHDRVTVASTGSSLFEVGREACDYTWADSPIEVAETVDLYLTDPELLAAREDFVREHFRPLRWDRVGVTVQDVLTGLESAQELRQLPVPEQLTAVVVSSDAAVVRRAITAWDRTGVVSGWVLVTSRATADALTDLGEAPRVRLVPIDEDRPLLRQMTDLEDLGERFIWLDPHCIPLDDVRTADLLTPDGRHVAAYSGDLAHWSYRDSDRDHVLRETGAALAADGLESLVYGGEEPQLVDRRLLAEAASWAERTGIEVDPLSTYLNVSISRRPTLFAKQPHRSRRPPRGAAGLIDSPPADRTLFTWNDSDGGRTEEAGQALADAERSQRMLRRSHIPMRLKGVGRGPLRFDLDGLTVVLAGVPRLVPCMAGSAVAWEAAFQVRDRSPRARRVAIGWREQGAVRPVVSLELGGDATYRCGQLFLDVTGGAPGTRDLETVVLVDGEEATPAQPTTVRVVGVAADEPFQVVRHAIDDLAARGAGRPASGVRAALERARAGAGALRRRLAGARVAPVEQHGGPRSGTAPTDQPAPAPAPGELVALSRLVASDGAAHPLLGRPVLGGADPRRAAAYVDLVQEQLGRFVGQRVLVLGAGYGYVAMSLAEHGAKVEAWDTSPRRVEIARAAGRLAGAGVAFRLVADVAAMADAVPADRYDVAVVDPSVDLADVATRRAFRLLQERVPRTFHVASGPADDGVDGPAGEVVGELPGGGEVVEHQLERTVVVGAHVYPYTHASAEAYAGSPMATSSDSFRRFYFHPEHVIKEYHYPMLRAEEIKQPLNEIALFVTRLNEQSVHHGISLLDFEVTQETVTLVLRAVPGELVSDRAPLAVDELVLVASDVLRTLVDLDAVGLHHNDLRSWNILASEAGGWVIDYGLAGSEPIEDAAIAFLWAMRTAITGTLEDAGAGKRHLPDATDFAGTPLESTYRLIAEGERDVSRLLASLDQQ